MKDTVFYFGFSLYDVNSDEEDYVNKGFIIKEYEFHVETLEDEQAWLDAIDKFESPYGVHDQCTAPDDRVNAIGFGTYEVEKNKVNELMEGWRQHFIDEGYTVTEVVEYVDDDDYNDFDIYQKILGKI